MKLSQKLVNGSTTITTDYMGGLIYRNDSLKTILNDEGRIAYKNDTTYSYQFFILDHLGNTRVIIERLNSTTALVQETHYGAWGEILEGIGQSGEWKFLYQGNEYIDAFGYNTSDFNLRQYDSYRGQFDSIDPIDNYSVGGTVGMLNNPLTYTDKNGDCPQCVVGAIIGGGLNLWSNWDAVAKTKGGWAKFGKAVGFFGLGALEGAFIAAAPGAGFVKIAASVAGRAIITGTVKSIGNVILGGNPDQLNPTTILTNAAITGLTVGTFSGLTSVFKGGNFFFGVGRGYGGDLTLLNVVDDAGNEVASKLAGTTFKAPDANSIIILYPDFRTRFISVNLLSLS